MAIKSKMNTYLTNAFKEARSISWAPKLPYCPASGAFQLHNIHLEQITMYMATKVIPIAYYDIEFAIARVKHLMTETCKLQIDLLARAPSINLSGIINFYLDYVFLRNFIREQ